MIVHDFEKDKASQVKNNSSIKRLCYTISRRMSRSITPRSPVD